MLPTKQGSIRLFRLFGIDVFLHWSWFAIALYTLSSRAKEYSSPVWNVAEYLALFLIVLMHEFGHSLACRQTGGVSEQIVLWPLGGVAYVAPPQRPGAQLWSIAAGPLVNVALAPILFGALWFLGRQGLWDSHADFMRCLRTINRINGGLLLFNLLPIYPLDGGQILRSVLWYFLGPVTSLLVATVIGLVGGVVLVALGLWQLTTDERGRGDVWMVVVAGFLLFNCWQSFRYARAWRAHLAALPRTPPQSWTVEETPR